MLFAARNLNLQPGFGKALLDLERDRINLPAVLAAQLFKPGVDGGVAFGLQFAKRQRLHFTHIFIHPHTLGQRGVDIHRLARDALALFGRFNEMQRAHIVQPVSQLDQQHADIFGHGEQELAQVFRRTFILGHCLDLGKFGDAIDQPRDFGAEMRLDILDRGKGVFHRIMQQRGDDGRLIELEVSHQARHFDRVAEIGIAARAFLGAVFLHGIDIGAVQHRLIGVRVVIEDLLNEFVLAQHSGRIWARGPDGASAILQCNARSVITRV